MAFVYILLAIGLFSLNLYLTLRYGSDYPLWLRIVIVAIFGSLIFFVASDFVTFLGLLIFSALMLSSFIAFTILRRQAGKQLATYKSDEGNLFWNLLYVIFFFYIAFEIVSLNQYSYPDGASIHNRNFFYTELPIGILIAFLGISSLLTIFRKGEIFEHGITDHKLNFFPWSGYKAYEWVGYTEKNEKQFLLFLEGARNVSLSIEGISEQDKNTLEELLATKLPKILNPHDGRNVSGEAE